MRKMRMLKRLWMLVGTTVSLFFLSSSSCVDDNNENQEKHDTDVFPQVVVSIPGGQAPDSKNDYIDGARMTIFGEDHTEQFSGETMIKGRGNVNWYDAPKKSYAIKLPIKVTLLDMPAGKTWVLLGNFYDKTLLRNDIALYISSRMSKLDYTPRFEFVELWLNDEYYGIYQMGEKMRLSANRVNNGKDGFLLEIDAKSSSNDVTFRTLHLEQPVNIKDPNVGYGTEEYNYVKEYVLSAEQALYSQDFTDESEGYRKYLDIDSFVDWYIINEISKNNDAAFYTSCYMHLEKGGKLKMGPVWDFDWAFGGTSLNGNENPEGFWVRYAASWYTRLFLDPAFKSQVKKRFKDYYLNRQQIYDRIDKEADRIVEKIAEDNRKWNQLLGKDQNPDDERVKEVYMEKVEELKNWIEVRLKWMNNHIEDL